MNFDGLCMKCMQGQVAGGYCARCGAPADFVQSVRTALPQGSILHGCYLLGAALGAGGFGVTYLAMHIPTGRRVAVKEFLPESMARRASDGYTLQPWGDKEEFQTGRARFLKEAQTIYALRGYPGLVGVEKLFEENNTAYYVMEFLDGCDMKKHIARQGGRLSFSQTAAILAPVLDALAYVHSNGVIHRDISPDNIFLCGSGAVKLIDFGAAYAAMRESSTDIQLVVKRGFAPMEQYITKGHLGPWSDLYAFCCTFYYSITGQTPPDAPSRNFNDQLTPPSALGADIPPLSERALLKGMAVRSQERYLSAWELRAALLDSVSSLPGGSYVQASCQSALLPPGRPPASPWEKVSSVFKAWLSKGSLSSGRCPGQALAIRSASGMFCGCVFTIGEQPVRIGRDASQCGIVFPDDTGGVSRLHCEIRMDVARGVIMLTDRMSTYGTQIIDGPLLRGQSADLGLGAGFLVGREMFIVTMA